jgi:hypothetical protein
MPGAGWLWFRVWENGNPDNFEDVFFSLHTPGVTDVSAAPDPGISISPNPVSTFLNLESSFGQPTPAYLFDSNGRLLWTGTLNPGQRTHIDCTTWPTGPYFLQTIRKTYTILRVP